MPIDMEYAEGPPPPTGKVVLSLKDYAVAALAYLGLPHADGDIGVAGVSAAVYADAWLWANLAAQEFADHGAWPWLQRCFVSVTLPASAYRADLPPDVHRLLSDPSYEDALYLFEPATLQQIQQLRAGLTGSTGVPPTVLALGYATEDTVWAADHLQAVGDFVRPTAAEGPFRYECTVAAGDKKTHAATEPTWPTILATTVVDDQITWTCRLAGRPQLIVWPENGDTARTLKVAYSRMLPAMTAEAHVPLIPANLHRHVLTGTLAYAEAHYNHDWTGGARKAFEAGKAEAWRTSQPSSQHQVAMYSHAHVTDLRRIRRPDPTFTHA